MIKSIYLIILLAHNCFAMEQETFPWDNLPNELKLQTLDFSWGQLDKQNPKKLAESLIESLKKYNNMPKTNKDFYDQITDSYNKFLNNLTENDFKKLNRFISYSLETVQIPKDFNLLVRFLRKLNKLNKINVESLDVMYFINEGFASVKELIDAGAELDSRDDYEDTALMAAIRYGYQDVAELLINSGANVNISNKMGFTPLILASFYNRNKILELLLKAGAKLDTKNKDGKTALDFALANKNQQIITLLKKHGAKE